MAIIIGGGKAFGGTAIVLVIIAFVEAFLGIGIVCLRVVKTRSQHIFKWDLFWVVAATLTGILLQLLGLLSTLNGLGRSKTELSQEQIALALKWAWIGIAVGIFSLAFGKLAIIALYLQVANAAGRAERFFLWAMAFIVSAAAVTQTVLLVIQCDPLDRLWDTSIPGQCPGSLLSTRFGYFQGAFSAFTDFILALYPITIIWDVKTSKATKLGISVVMAGGLIPFAAAVGRAIHLKILERLDDPTRDLVPLCIWAITEQWAVIFLGCLPPLRSYFARFFRGIASSPHESRSLSPIDRRSPTHGQPTASMAAELSNTQTIDVKHDTQKNPAVMVGVLEHGKEFDRDVEEV
ncbi:hypothetical protein BDZ85DRAFT_82666 [Elsinoe ampelina]|uniref:Rhodopsin domain-containing protein n=1 Tax=Elsinoe ampelina TaxID=302913 RepID=A0A6A6GGF2_9PEZI|nr:hypothetical protein BDZ85DRAFT_82666 [Elsinoe ampelina]